MHKYAKKENFPLLSKYRDSIKITEKNPEIRKGKNYNSIYNISNYDNDTFLYILILYFEF